MDGMVIKMPEGTPLCIEGPHRMGNLRWLLKSSGSVLIEETGNGEIQGKYSGCTMTLGWKGRGGVRVAGGITLEVWDSCMEWNLES